MKNSNQIEYKKCPRCGAKVISPKFCVNCELVFDRLKYASNKEAKKNLKLHNKDYVIYTNIFPSDLSRKKTMLYCIFLGFFGAHNFYVGKIFRGIYNLIAMIIAIIAVVIPTSAFNAVYDTALSICTPFISISLLLWLIDLMALISNKFRVPISLNLDKE